MVVLMLLWLGLGTCQGWALLPLSRATTHPMTSLSAKPESGNSIYSMPSLYDLAFGYRDFEQEVDFLLSQHERISGTKAVSVLEVAAGPARHCLTALDRPFVRDAYCIDANSEMCEYAHSLAKEQLADFSHFHYQISDMRNFTLPQAVDSAWILLGSLQHMTSQEDVKQCLQCVYNALNEKGTLFLELPHPKEIFALGEWTRNAWEIPLDFFASVDDNSKPGELKVVWGDENDSFDVIAQVRQFTVELQLFEDSSKPPSSKIQQVVPMRIFTSPEIEALANLCGFRIEHLYGALEDGVSIDDEESAFRLVCALQKA